MGCNSSKQDDIEQDRQRVRTQQDAHHGNRGGGQGMPTSPSKSIGGGGDMPDDMQAGQSYSDKKDREAEYFKNIIDRTAANLIDVGQQTPSPLANDDAIERSRNYGDAVTDNGDLAVASAPLFSLPIPTTSQGPISNLSSPPIAVDIGELATSASAIASALHQFNVRDVGAVVVPFPEVVAF
eukprot:TRINITY_DN1432_c0_g1_i2.p1 TRINITY_DN1432_c0_g1~~TRINITY_DN1432_c0_g1_i2.p1  ORF type:complete len:182 (-),score=44.72 TRINITY_DN1432_c0_g1_i2:170-715(-)